MTSAPDASWEFQEKRLSALEADPDASAADEALARARCLLTLPQRNYRAACDAYRRAALAIAMARAIRSEPAARYEDMAAFWRDAADQEKGVSPNSYWDTYEHGHRRWLEALLARTYGAESALLVNSGMTAMDCAIRGSYPHTGTRLLAAERQYFETAEYLELVMAANGSLVTRRPLKTNSALREATSAFDPHLVLLESFLNGPEVDPAPDLRGIPSSVRCIIDNSVLGHGARWFNGSPAQILVVESGLKYLCHRCSFGVIYGPRALIDEIRLYARRIGVQLQAAALHHLNPFELVESRRRVMLHGVRRALFRAVLEHGPWAWIRDGGDAALCADPETQTVLAGSGGGALLFLAAQANENDAPRQHAEILRQWRQRCHEEGCPVEIQAGFGWDWTSARAYDGSTLNRIGAGSFIRVSVGIAPKDETARCAQLLNDTCEAVSGRTRVFSGAG